MDECCHDDIEHIIQYFDNLGDALILEGKAFYVCLSSRHYPNLRSSKSVELLLESQHGHDDDIRQYIHQRLLIDREDLKRDLAESIQSKAYGVFLWVVLVVALVNQDDRNGNAAEIYQRLDQIPTGLSNLFSELIERGTNSHHFRPLLQWVAFTKRSLSSKELYCILMHGTVTTDLEPLTFDANNVVKFILSASKGLVETTNGPFSRVQFIHESLRTYFLGRGVIHLIDNTVVDRVRNDRIRFGIQESVAMTAHCHDQLKERCLAYVKQVITVIDPLWLKPVMALADPKRQQRRQILTAYPFMEHAVYGLMRHGDTALELGLNQQTFVDSLPCNDLNILYDIMCSKPRALWEPTNTELWYKAYTAARFGCPKLLKVVMETQPPFAASQWQRDVILCASIEVSDFEGSSIALHAGADPNASMTTEYDPCLRYAIDSASKRNRHRFLHSRGWDIVELLLKHGARPCFVGEGSLRSLFESCANDDTENVRRLLGLHSEADIRGADYCISLARAIGKASRLGHESRLQSLLHKGAEAKLWPRVTVSTLTDRDAFFEVTVGDISIVRVILAEAPQLSASNGVMSRGEPIGTLINLTLRFKQRIQRVDSRS